MGNKRGEVMWQSKMEGDRCQVYRNKRKHPSTSTLQPY